MELVRCIRIMSIFCFVVGVTTLNISVFTFMSNWSIIPEDTEGSEVSSPVMVNVVQDTLELEPLNNSGDLVEDEIIDSDKPVRVSSLDPMFGTMKATITSCAILATFVAMAQIVAALMILDSNDEDIQRNTYTWFQITSVLIMLIMICIMLPIFYEMKSPPTVTEDLGQKFIDLMPHNMTVHNMNEFILQILATKSQDVDPAEVQFISVFYIGVTLDFIVLFMSYIFCRSVLRFGFEPVRVRSYVVV